MMEVIGRSTIGSRDERPGFIIGGGLRRHSPALLRTQVVDAQRWPQRGEEVTDADAAFIRILAFPCVYRRADRIVVDALIGHSARRERIERGWAIGGDRRVLPVVRDDERGRGIEDR